MGFVQDLARFEFLRISFVGGILVAVLAAIVSPFVVFRRMEFIGDGTAHATFAGLALAFLLGLDHRVVSLLTAIAFALSVSALSRRRVSENSAIGILLSFFMALGMILFSLPKRYKANVIGFLFGDILLVNKTDVWMTLFVLTFVLLFLIAFRWEIKYFLVDEEMAKFFKLKTGFVKVFILLFISLVVVTIVKVVGIVLTSAMLIIPGMVAKAFARGFSSLLLVSVIYNFVTFVLGFYLAYRFDLPPGPCIVMGSFSLFLPVLKFL